MRATTPETLLTPSVDGVPTLHGDFKDEVYGISSERSGPLNERLCQGIYGSQKVFRRVWMQMKDEATKMSIDISGCTPGFNLCEQLLGF